MNNIDIELGRKVDYQEIAEIENLSNSRENIEYDGVTVTKGGFLKRISHSSESAGNYPQSPDYTNY